MGFGNKLFGVDIAALIFKATNGQLLSATLHKVVVLGPDPNDLSGKPLDEDADFPCQGFVDAYKDTQIDGTIIKKSDRRITLIGDSIKDGAVPEPNDFITIEGVRRKVVEGGVNRDPAKATYECQSR